MVLVAVSPLHVTSYPRILYKFFALRAPAEARPEARIRKSLFFPCFSLNFWLKTRFLKSRDPGPTKRELMKPLPARFRDENVQKPINNWKFFLTKTMYFSKNQAPGPFPNERSWNFASIGVLWIPLYDQIWPIWWRKRVKNMSKWRFPTVPDSSQGFTEVSRRFPTLLEGLRWCPKVPSLLPRRCMLRKNLITECREKSEHRVPSKTCMSRKKQTCSRRRQSKSG